MPDPLASEISKALSGLTDANLRVYSASVAIIRHYLGHVFDVFSVTGRPLVHLAFGTKEQAQAAHQHVSEAVATALLIESPFVQ